ncbi:MAG: tyrosine-type recombinase/integrase [Candidatus Limnocylindria bacterium]
MRNGSIIKYAGRRGVVWRLRYRDADGRRVSETLGREADGWDKRRATEALRERLVDVRREGRRKLEPMRFETFAHEWLASYPDQQDLKRSTRESYEMIIERHLIPELGRLKLAAIGVEALNRYLARKRGQGLQPRTLNRHLNLLHSLFKAAEGAELVRSNPVRAIKRPREPRRRWTILTPVEIRRVEQAFRELAEEADGGERAWIEQARVVFLTIVSAGLRRGEILGLRWRDVSLADPAGATLRIRETWVRDQRDTPKSEKSERTIAIGRLAEELFEHRGRSAFEGDDERVFCHPQTGGPLDHKRYAVTLRAALAKAKIEKPMRPFHDGRHSSITNAAAAGLSPAALMARAGHSDFATTQIYIDLAGETFREEAALADERVFGQKSGQT